MGKRLSISLFADDQDPSVIRYIHDDDAAELLRGLGDLQETKRASHVEPDPAHPGQWLADMSPTTGTPCTLGPFPTRRSALDAERRFLERFLSGIPTGECHVAEGLSS